MATFQNTVTIRRAIEDVFAFLADFENVPTWNYAIVETKKTSPGPVGVGTTYQEIRSIPDRSEEGFKVIAFEPTSRLEVPPLVLVHGAPADHTRWRWHTASAGNAKIQRLGLNRAR